MSDFREIYFENQFGNGLFIKVPCFYNKNEIWTENEWLVTNKDKTKNSYPLQVANLKFIDFAHYLSEENCQKIFGGVDAYIGFLYQKDIKTSSNSNNGNWILLFNYR